MKAKVALELVEEFRTFLKVIHTVDISAGTRKKPKGFTIKFEFLKKPSVENTTFLDRIAGSEGAAFLPEGKSITLVFLNPNLRDKWFGAFIVLRSNDDRYLGRFKDTDDYLQSLKSWGVLA